jgi:hypothetical protein
MAGVPRLRRSWRWVVVLVAVTVLVSLPVLVAHRPAHTEAVAPRELARRILASASTPYQGYASTRGGLQFPDLPRAGRATALLGDRSALRAWVASPTSWRVDELSTTGEHDTYRHGSTVWTWDSQARRAGRTEDTSSLRLPRADDLLPPTLGRRLLAGASAAELQPLGATRVAGRAVAGLRIVPASADTIVGVIDIWADPASGVPLQVNVTARGATHPAIESTFLDFSLDPPSPTVVTFEPPPGVRVDIGNGNTAGLDLVQLATRFARLELPDTLAGVARTTPSAAAATYGSGFTVVTVVAVTQRNTSNLLGADVPSTVRPWGQARVLSTPLVSVMAVTTNRATYVLAGPVPLEVLDRYAQAVATGGAP